MTRFSAAMAAALADDAVYTVDRAGNVARLTLDAYEMLPSSDPRLHRVAWTRRQAELISLRVRGIETGLEVARESN